MTCFTCGWILTGTLMNRCALLVTGALMNSYTCDWTLVGKALALLESGQSAGF